MSKKLLAIFALTFAATSFAFAGEAEEPKEETTQEEVCVDSTENEVTECTECTN